MKIDKYKNVIVDTLIIIFLLILLILIYPYNYDEIVDSSHNFVSLKHLFGTDYLGRDFFIRNMYAMLITILIALFSIVCSVFIGAIYGMYAGYKGGKIFKCFKVILNILESIPDFLLAIILVIIFNNYFSGGSILGIFITMIFISWTSIARIIMDETLAIMKNEYIQYAMIRKASFIHVMKFHLIPNLKRIILILIIQKIPSSIFIESFLSFVGIGIQPPFPSLGKMINDGVKYFRIYPWELLIPSLILVLIVFYFNYIGEKIIKMK